MATVEPFEAKPHERATKSHAGRCAWGGEGTCDRPGEFSVRSDVKKYVIACCEVHLAGAVRYAVGLPAKTIGRLARGPESPTARFDS